MGDFKVAIDFHTSPVVAGALNYTLSTEGNVPALVVVETLQTVALDTFTNYIVGCRGITDGTSQGMQQWSCQNGVGQTNTSYAIQGNQLLSTFNPGTTVRNSRANLVSVTADTLRLDWTIAPSTAYRFKTTSYYGTAAQGKVWAQSLGNNTQFIHNFGTTNHHMYLAMMGGPATSQGAGIHAFNGIGRALWVGVGVPSAVSAIWYSQDNLGAEAPKLYVNDGDFLTFMSAGGVVNQMFDIDEANSNSFRLNQTLGANNRYAVVAALDLGSSKGHVAVDTLPATGTSWTKTGVGFESLFFENFQTKTGVLNNTTTGPAAETVASGASIASVSNVLSNGVEDDAGQTVVRGKEYAGHSLLLTDAITEIYRSGVPTINNDGWVLNFNVAQTVGARWLTAAIQDQDAGGGTAIEPDDVAFNFTADQPVLSSKYTVTPNDAAFALTMDQPTITHKYTVSPADALFGLVFDQAVVVTAGGPVTITPNDAAFAFPVEQATLASKYIVAPANSSFGFTIEQAVLAHKYVINPADSTIGVTFDAAQVIIAGAISPNTFNIGLAFESPVVTHRYTIVPNDVAFALLADVATLTHAYTVNAADVLFALGFEQAVLPGQGIAIEAGHTILILPELRVLTVLDEDRVLGVDYEDSSPRSS